MHMSLPLCTAQEIFLLFYSILYGIMLNSMLGFSPFPLEAAIASLDHIFEKKNVYHHYAPTSFGKNKAIRMLGLSFILINLLPFLNFACSFLKIGQINSGCGKLDIVLIALVSLTVFGFQRLWLFCAMCRFKGKPVFYTRYDYRKLLIIKKGLVPKQIPHLLAAFFYFLFLLLVPFVNT